MAFADQLAAVRERQVQGDDEMPVARQVDRTGGSVAPLDESAEGHRRELALRIRLIEAGPERGTLSGVLADRKCVEQLQPGRIRERAQDRRGAVIGVLVRALEQRRVAVEEVAVPVDQVVLPVGNTTAV